MSHVYDFDAARPALQQINCGDTFEDLLSALADPALAAVTVMHSDPEVIPDAIQAIRHHFAGPIGAYAENGDWVPLTGRLTEHPVRCASPGGASFR